MQRMIKGSVQTAVRTSHSPYHLAQRSFGEKKPSHSPSCMLVTAKPLIDFIFKCSLQAVQKATPLKARMIIFHDTVRA